MSKAALEEVTRCHFLELANKEVCVNIVEPGLVYTDFRQNFGFNDEQTEKMYNCFKANVPIKRVAAAKGMAPTTSILASEGANYITGVSLKIDAGFQLV